MCCGGCKESNGRRGYPFSINQEEKRNLEEDKSQFNTENKAVHIEDTRDVEQDTAHLT